MSLSIHEELHHRGEPLVAYPDADLWKAVGGSDGVAALIQDLTGAAAPSRMRRRCNSRRF